MRRRAWRIVQAHLASNAFDGEGARLYSGRWNHRGVPVVYAASTKSLAVLELLVHAQSHQLLRAYVCIPVGFSLSLVHALEPAALPPDWRVYPATHATKDIGSRWAESMASVLLEVPSAIIPEESVYLLNPRHPDFKKVIIGPPAAFEVDPRFYEQDSEPLK